MKKLLVDILKEKHDILSDSQKKVAKYLMEQPEESAFKTAAQIGMEVGVSESTVIRLSYAMGLEGFSQLQKMIRDQFIKTNSTVYKFQTSTELISANNNVFANVLAKDVAIINNLMNSINEDDLWKVVDSIIGADKVIVVGHRVSYGPAHWFSFMLNIMLGTAYLHPSGRNEIEGLFDLTESSIAVVISVSRYSKETVRVAEIAKEKGAKVIAISDNILSPVGRLSDITFTTEINNLSGIGTGTSITALLNLIIAGISKRHKKNIKKRLRVLEKDYSRYEIFESF